MKKDTIIVGRVSGVHGIKGEIKVIPLTDDHQRYFDLETITLFDRKSKQDYQIKQCRVHKNTVLITLEGINNRNLAEQLIGMEISIDRELAVELKEDEYFIEDLKGMDVYNLGSYLGKITDILQTGGVDVYFIENDEKKYSVPARKLYFKTFDFEANQIEAQIPEEILEL